MKVELDFILPEMERPLEGNYQLNQDILEHLFSTAKIDRKFNHYLKDKSVIIVGPASYMEGTKRKEFIESFDIVIRLNNGWLPKEFMVEDVGSRTDIRWHSGAEWPNTGGMWDMDKMIDHGVKYACIQYPKNLDYFHNDIKKFEKINQKYNMPFHNWSDLELYLSFHHYLGTRLSVGMAAVTDIMFYDIKKLHVSGFSFYADKGGHDWMPGVKPEGYYLDDYDKERHTFINHAQIPQMKLLRELQQFDSRLSFDQETELILQKYNV